MSVSTLLSRLEKVKNTGPGRWIACCPAHGDNSPSLSIREADDRTLIYCFAGCGAIEVLHAIGATWADVMPLRRFPEHRTRKAPPVPYKDILLALRHEAMVCLLCADAALMNQLTDYDAARLSVAISRIEIATRFAR